jgi:hypothetical protein
VLGPLAPDEQLAFSPVDVLETKGRHLARTQPEPDKHQEHSEVTPTIRGSTVAVPKKRSYGWRFKRPRQESEPPRSDPRNSIHERPWRAAAEMAVAKESPKSRH